MLRLETIHPMIVHFPIVLVFCLLALDAYAAWRGKLSSNDSPIANASVILAVAAGVFAIIAFMFGDQAYDIAISAGRAPRDILEMHQGLGTFTAWAIAAWAVIRIILWWRRFPIGSSLRLAVVGVEALLVILVIATAWYGGQLVYDYGVAVNMAVGQ